MATAEAMRDRLDRSVLERGLSGHALLCTLKIHWRARTGTLNEL
jgi:hypothetical protein